MPRGENQKLKLPYLYRILKEHSDPDHPISMPRLIEMLEGYGVKAERKSVYDDIAALETLGITVEYSKRGYYLDTRLFEPPELKMLVDAVQAARFLTRETSNALIKKLESTVSEYDARLLSRQIYVADRTKTMNKTVMNAVDAIHAAILDNKQIRFRYYHRNMYKEKIYGHSGTYYHVSPFSLVWNDENYYLIAYDGKKDEIRHYRVDRMEHTSVTKAARDGKGVFNHFDLANYAKSLFGMFRGDATLVTLSCDESLADVIFDRFGDDVTLIPESETRFKVAVNVIVSPNFLSYTLSFGDRIKIVSPPETVEKVKEMIRTSREIYGDD